MNMSTKIQTLTLAALMVTSGCGESQPPIEVAIPVVVDATGPGSAETDLGYRIELTEARFAFGNVRFLTGGSEHASLPARAYDLVIPSARAHPGHGEGGEVMGELPGEYEVDWVSEGARDLGSATLLEGDYTSASLTLARLSEAPELSIRLAGTATREGESTDFSVEVAAPEGREITAIYFPHAITSELVPDGLLRFRFVFEEVFGQGHLFDGVDFEALATGGVMSFGATENDPIYLEVRRRLLSHDHVKFQLQE